MSYVRSAEAVENSKQLSASTPYKLPESRQYSINN